MTDFPVLDISESANDIDWEAVNDLFGSKPDENFDVTSLLKGISLGGGKFKTLLRIEDKFGWDDMILLPDGNILWEDRNSGLANLTTTPPADVDEFLKSLIDLLKD